jgi:hypothetical protein
MTTLILPVFAQGVVETVARALKTGDVAQWTDEEAMEGVALCRQTVAVLRAVRRQAERELDKGVEAMGFVAAYEPILGLTAELAPLKRLDERVAGLELPARTRAFRDEVRAIVEAGDEVIAFLQSEVSHAQAPPRPVDAARLEHGLADAAAGRTHDLGDLLLSLTASAGPHGGT